jgi:hypothetical protein
MLDYNTRQLAAWVLREFRAQLLLCAFGALAAGYAFGCFSKARVPADCVVSVFDLNSNPAKYNARRICVKGSLLNLKTNAADSDVPYSVFSLKENKASGEYDFVNIISFARRQLSADGSVLACGIFSAVKQVGKDTYHNVIVLNRVEGADAGPEEGPISGARRSRSF